MIIMIRCGTYRCTDNTGHNIFIECHNMYSIYYFYLFIILYLVYDLIVDVFKQ